MVEFTGRLNAEKSTGLVQWKMSPKKMHLLKYEEKKDWRVKKEHDRHEGFREKVLNM